jgi:hypothetical protein
LTSSSFANTCRASASLRSMRLETAVWIIDSAMSPIATTFW